MDFKEVMRNENVDFSGIESSYFLLGLLSAFDNRFQAVADNSMKEISWKQFFAIICINLCKESPTIKELAEIMGSSHQNVKQILNKLEDKGYVKIVGLSMANALAALSGSVYCQQNGFFEISSGTGTIVIGLASVIIGTRVLKNVRFVKATTAVIFGSLVYKACVAIAIAAGLESQDLKLIIATLFLVILLLCNGFGRKKVKGNA